MRFNPAPSTVMLMDINSCFATIEQQANPLLRGHPVAVAAFATKKGCILAASVEAKKFGIKTGMRVVDGQALYSKLIVLPPDPWKYRNVHLKLRKIIGQYTDDFAPKSIDEFVLNLGEIRTLRKLRESDYPRTRSSEYSEFSDNLMFQIAGDIKQRIKKEIGDWITVSIGIAPNRYLAKVAAGLHKPDGLDEINKDNFLEIYSKLKLTDLTGIKERNAARLNGMGIYSVLDFYNAPIWKLRAAFHSITGLYWHTRLSGYEVDDVEFARKSYGNSIAIGKQISKIEDLSPILSRLTEKTCARLRNAGYKARGVHLMISYKNGGFWHEGHLLGKTFFDARDFYRVVHRLLLKSPTGQGKGGNVLILAITCFDLTKENSLQLEIFENIPKKKKLVEAQDKINDLYGAFTVSSARSFGGAKVVIDRIAFGGIKELEEFTQNAIS